MKVCAIPDVQNMPDGRNIPIDKVGVRGLKYPISVKDRKKCLQHTVGLFDLFVKPAQGIQGNPHEPVH